MDPLRNLPDPFDMDDETRRKVVPLASAAFLGGLLLIGALMRRKDLRVRENMATLGANVNHAAHELAEKIPFLPKSDANGGPTENPQEE